MRNAIRQNIADIVLAALVVAGAALLFVGASDLPPPRYEPLGPAALPRILGAFLVFCAVVLTIRAALRIARGIGTDAAPSRADPGRGALVLVALVVYVGALDIGRAPFMPATTLFVMGVGLAIGTRTWMNALIFFALGAVLSFAIFTIFERFLYISIG